MDTSVSVQFLGGVADEQNLTGSCSLLQVKLGKNTYRFLIDVGLVQCRFRESLERNLAILQQFKPISINGIILTHAHIDHGGRIPLMVKHKFNGRIYCTEQTANLLPIMLEDNAKIQLSEALFREKKLKKYLPEKSSFSKTWLGNYDKTKRKAKSQRQHDPLCEPLYTMEHVKETCALIKAGGYQYEEWIKLTNGIDLKFYPSGHVLGGAICVFRISKRKGFLYLGFSGDLGRSDGVILPPPKLVEEPINYWFTESTYGGRTHPLREQEIERLLAVIEKAVVEKKKIIIPSFALERTQEIIYLISKYIAQKNIPEIPIFLDSPMAVKITKIFSSSWHSPGLFKGQNELHFNPFCPEENKLLRLVVDQDASSKLIEAEGPCIVIAGSGMCDAGRVRGHLRKGLGKEKTIICLVGYMTEGSLGRKLKEHHPLVRMNGEEILVKANVLVFESFSAHADSPFLNTYVRNLANNPDSALKGVFIVHGEKKSGLDLKVELMKNLKMKGDEIVIPKIGDIFTF